jgi:hypothetical protein
MSADELRTVDGLVDSWFHKIQDLVNYIRLVTSTINSTQFIFT